MQSKLIVFVIGETTKAKKTKEAVQTTPAKSAPHYFSATVPQQFVAGQEKITLRDKEAQLLLKSYKDGVLLVEVKFDDVDVFSDETLALKEETLNYCREYLKKKGGRDVDELSEEYSVFVVSSYDGDPEDLFQEYKEKIVGLLKSEKLSLDQSEIDYTLGSKIKYAKNDLVIVEWDGAFVFDPEGDHESTLELLELANFQLLKYRLLDKQLDERLHRVAELVGKAPGKTRFLFKASDIEQYMKEMMLTRSASISEFQALDRDIKLIGDWYSARLYDLVYKKFKVDEWRRGVKDKLEALADVYSIASENFTVTWEKRSRIIEMVGWYVLLFGWLILLVLDIYFYRR